MNRPTRQDPAGRAYLDLQNRARRERRTTQELLTLYVLERWLARLAVSPHAHNFVLKGGLLLSVFEARRPTSDADLLARHVAGDQESVVRRVNEIARITLAPDDGVRYLTETITTQAIRDDSDYTGVRISMNCQLSTAAVRLKLDINIGDPITPAPQLCELPSQRPDTPPVTILGYPVETVLAEKTSTAIALGEANTRVRDYVDVYTLTGKHSIALTTMRAALTATATCRGVVLKPLSDVVGEFSDVRQPAYDAFRRLLGPDGVHLPTNLNEVVADVIKFVDPLVNDDGSTTLWLPADRTWL